MGNVIHVDFGQTNPPCPPDEYADVISIVAELEPAPSQCCRTRSLQYCSPRTGAITKRYGATCASSIDQYVNCSWHRKG
jgi:hypothetical protein